MAESFIFSIAESLTTKIASRAYEEASQVVGVYDVLQDLKSSLSYVKAVLLDAEQKQEQNHELREWLKQIKLIFYDAENLLDQVDCETLRKRVVRDYGTPKDKVGRFFSSSNPLVFRYKLALQIKDIRKRLDRVAADRDKFGLQVIDVDRRVVHSREMTYSHVVESDVIGRTYYYFNIHDLVHDLALYVAKDECLVISSESQNIPKNVLHISFFEFDMFLKSFKPSLLGVRTIAVPTEEHIGIGDNNEDLFPTWVLNCKYLRYLDLADSTFEILPRSISKLKHLRYLSLRDNGRVKKLPASICNLQNLEELNLSGCVELQTLPEKLRNLINLRRISITTKQFVLPEDDLANLCLLEHLHIYECDNLESTFVGVKLPTLRFLWIMRCKNLKSLPLDKHHFPQLEQFVVDECVKFELSDGHEDMNSVLRLKTLFFCMMVNFPPSLHGYANTLQTLVFLRCYELEALPEWLLNMTSLKFLHIWSCPRLLSLPSGIHCLKALEVLRIERCPRLYRKYQPHVGEYWHQISHIKHIQILQ
ncbi:hypothetical protein Ahy_B06g080254 isoform C [Arachis hypogaea]|uniref:Uncharacterized protein n=1 Tax=Arachis hypogaea TaxID=3818 RepID=A0A444YHL6_ARAHY|nr:hypothetical protein Ahy_B06g080254 isoform C [Arachis hypogaea]